MSWHRILQLNETYYKEVELELKQPPGPVVYYHPAWPEAAVFLPREFRKLRSLLGKYSSPVELLENSGKNLIFKGEKNSFTDVKFYDIILSKLGEKREMEWFACKHYDHRVNAAVCIGRSLLWPKQLFDPEEVERERDRFHHLAKTSKSPAERKYFRKQAKKLSATLDPYPMCRRCVMLRKIEDGSCLGKEFDPKDKECIDCGSQSECCHLMRLRIERIIDDREREVIKELEGSGQIKTIKQLTEETMAKRRKKAEEVTEEVVEEEEEEEEEEETPKKKKKAKKSIAKTPAGKLDKEVRKLLKELEAAREEKDNETARSIRIKLRKDYNYYLSQQ